MAFDSDLYYLRPYNLKPAQVYITKGSGVRPSLVSPNAIGGFSSEEEAKDKAKLLGWEVIPDPFPGMAS